MTTVNSARESVYAQFISDWASTTEVTLDNENYDPPSDASWVRLIMRNNVTAQQTLAPVGFRKFNRFGIVFVQVFTKSDTATSTSDTLTSKARDVFEGKRLGGVDFRDVTIREIGVDGKWFQVNVEAPFDYTETK